MYGEVNEEMVEKYLSLIGESLFLANIETMTEKLYIDRFTVVDVKQIGAYKIVITFVTKNDMKVAL